MDCVKSIWRFQLLRFIAIIVISAVQRSLFNEADFFLVLVDVNTEPKCKIVRSSELIMSIFHLIWSNLILEQK